MLKFIVQMLILTGARKRELLDAQWQDFDINRCTWRIPISKSGKARFVPLSDGVLAVLAKTPQRYAHLSQDTLLAAANSATTALGTAMMPPERMAPVAAVPAAL